MQTGALASYVIVKDEAGTELKDKRHLLHGYVWSLQAHNTTSAHVGIQARRSGNNGQGTTFWLSCT